MTHEVRNVGICHRRSILGRRGTPANCCLLDSTFPRHLQTRHYRNLIGHPMSHLQTAVSPARQLTGLQICNNLKIIKFVLMFSRTIS